MKLSIIIPVFRGKDVLQELFERIKGTLSERYDFEVLFVCDGCDTDSKKVLEKLKESSPSKIKVFRFAHNYGQQRAIQFGFGQASGDFIVTMDEDLQHDPTDILKLVAKQIEGNYDIVYGRFKILENSYIKNLFSIFIRKQLIFCIPTLCSYYSPYRLIRKSCANKVFNMTGPCIFVDEFLSRVTHNISYVEIPHYKRKAGKSSYTFSKLIKLGLSIIFAYSKLCLYIIITTCSLTISGGIYLLWTILIQENQHKINYGNMFASEIVIFILFTLLFTYIIKRINKRNLFLNSKRIQIANEDSF
jgi:undecaprenyl-phosphate 4-deoxy-4-formamido-L-arabinose transferase